MAVALWGKSVTDDTGIDRVARRGKPIEELDMSALHEAVREASLSIPIDENGKLGIDPAFPTNEPGVYGFKQCAGTSSFHHRRCRNPVEPGRDYCKWHGGRTRVGALAPNYRHGRYSSYMPKALLDKYHDATGDAELLALRDEIALLDTRTQELLKRVDTGETGTLFLSVKKALKNYEKARLSGSGVGMSAAWAELSELVDHGEDDYKAWHEIRENLVTRQRLVESERKRLVDMQQMLSAEVALGMIGQIELLIKENVSDPAALTKISAGLVRLTAARPRR